LEIFPSIRNSKVIHKERKLAPFDTPNHKLTYMLIVAGAKQEQNLVINQLLVIF